MQVFPVCRVVGFFTVRGHAGLNRFRFNGRLHGRRLPIGTYQIGVHTRRGTLLRVTLAIFQFPVKSQSVIAAARKRNVCGDSTSFAPFATMSFGLPAGSGRSASGASSSSRSGEILGVTFSAAPKNLVEDLGRNPFAIVALGLALLLLGLAAVPRTATPGQRTADLLARRRSMLVLAGGAALVAGVIVVALG